MKYLSLFLWVFMLQASVIVNAKGAEDEGSGDEDSGDEDSGDEGSGGVAMDPNTTSELDLDDSTFFADMTEEPMHMDEAILHGADWLPVGQMVTDLGLLYKGLNAKAIAEKLDDESSDLENLHLCAKTLNDFATLPSYLTSELVKLYSEATSDMPEALHEERVSEMLGPQDDEGDESSSLTDDDLEAAVKVLVDDETENKLRQDVVASLSGIKDPLDGNLVMRIVAVARSLHAIQNMRCRNLCTSSECMNGSGLCNIKNCRVRKCPIFCYDSNLRYPKLNLCQDRPNIVHENHMYCCPHNFHPMLNITGGTVKCYC